MHPPPADLKSRIRTHLHTNASSTCCSKAKNKHTCIPTPPQHAAQRSSINTHLHTNTHSTTWSKVRHEHTPVHQHILHLLRRLGRDVVGIVHVPNKMSSPPICIATIQLRATEWFLHSSNTAQDGWDGEDKDSGSDNMILVKQQWCYHM